MGLSCEMGVVCCIREIEMAAMTVRFSLLAGKSIFRQVMTFIVAYSMSPFKMNIEGL